MGLQTYKLMGNIERYVILHTNTEKVLRPLMYSETSTFNELQCEIIIRLLKDKKEGSKDNRIKSDEIPDDGDETEKLLEMSDYDIDKAVELWVRSR